MGRRYFRYGELPLVLLALVSQRPRRGSELMEELTRLFGPAYRPSPGGVYPALRNLATEGLIRVEEGGAAAIHAITPEGARALEERRGQLASIEERTGRHLRRQGEVERLLERFAQRVGGLAGRVDPGTVASELEEAAGRLERAAVGITSRGES